jgi:predicted O-methyltransferase YrrM
VDTDTWASVDGYLESLLLPRDPALDGALAAAAAAGMPAMAVSPLQGQMLALLVGISGARRVLEIGTLGGYSTIWMARALPADGRLVTLEVDAGHAEVARASIEQAGVADRVEVRLGPALETLPGLADLAPFDLVFIDADKRNNPGYVDWAIELGRPGTVIVVDNVVRGGAVLDAASSDPNVIGTRAALDALAADPRLDATATQTVGSKGYDGFALAVIRLA